MHGDEVLVIFFSLFVFFFVVVFASSEFGVLVWVDRQVSTFGFKMDTSVFWASNMFIRPAFLLPQPPHHQKHMRQCSNHV
jgi:hypothetical protein